jgi:sugar phosphate isomerase/epimerase
MVDLAISQTTTFRWSFEEDVQKYAAAGIGSIGVWRQKLSDYGEEKGRELILETGLRVSSLHWAGGFTGSDGRSYQESVQDGARAVRLARELNAGCLIVYTGGRAGHTHNHARRLVKAALADLVAVAEEHGVILALEPMHAGCASEWTFLTSLDDALSFLEHVNSPRLKLVFDTYHLGQQQGIVERISQIVSQIALVQLGDAKQPPSSEQNRCRLGDGDVPIRDIISVLQCEGYAGDYEVELMGEEIEATDYEDLLAQCKSVFESYAPASQPT